MSYILDNAQTITMPISFKISAAEELLPGYTYGRKWNVAYTAESNYITIDNYKKNLDDIHRFYCSSVARKALPSYDEYEKSGWSEKMTGAGL